MVLTAAVAFKLLTYPLCKLFNDVYYESGNILSLAYLVGKKKAIVLNWLTSRTGKKCFNDYKLSGKPDPLEAKGQGRVGKEKEDV